MPRQISGDRAMDEKCKNLVEKKNSRILYLAARGQDVVMKGDSLSIEYAREHIHFFEQLATKLKQNQDTTVLFL